eukprot:2721821-Pyramimonas_sp.AAC.1
MGARYGYILSMSKPEAPFTNCVIRFPPTVLNLNWEHTQGPKPQSINFTSPEGSVNKADVAEQLSGLESLQQRVQMGKQGGQYLEPGHVLRGFNNGQQTGKAANLKQNLYKNV